MFPVSVCLGIEKPDGSPKIKYSASLLNPLVQRPIRYPGLRFGHPTTKMDGLFSMNERYIRWYTPWLSREFEMIVFGNGGGLPLILFPRPHSAAIIKTKILVWSDL